MTGAHNLEADPTLRPLSIKSTSFRNRIFSSSHACGLQVDGFPQQAYQAYHEEKARDGIGLSLFGGSSNVDIDSPNVFSQLNVGTDDIIEHLQQFSTRMHGRGAALMCQITHLGRRGDPYAQDWLPTIAPSPLRETLHRAFRREVDLPVLHAARISDLASARFALSQGHVDLVGMTRSHMADPYIVAKLMRGDEARIRPCVGARHCQAVHRPKCIHNGATGRETSLSHAIDKATSTRNTVVVGAGPAGLEAARVLGERGHKVTLLEAAAHSGGQVLLACEDQGRRDLIGIVDWRLSELQRLAIEVQCNQVVEAQDVLKLEPDRVVIATGGVPQTDFGSGSELCSSTWDILGRHSRATGEVMVFDGTGRQPGPAAAQQLHDAGATVQFVSIDSALAQDLTYAEATRWRKAFARMGLAPTYESRPTAVVRDGNRLRVTLQSDLTNATTQVIVDHLVVKIGTVPINDLFAALRPHANNDGVTDRRALAELRAQPHGAGHFELHSIGDAWASRNVHAAVYDALRLGLVS